MKTTAEMIEVMAAFECGEEIEWMRFDVWVDCPMPLWDWMQLDYRIKPKPTTPTYTESDIPLCATIRKKDLPQDVIDKACAALVRYANDPGHKCHRDTSIVLAENVDVCILWDQTDEGHDFWKTIFRSNERPDPYAEAKQAWRDGVLQWQILPDTGLWHDWTTKREPNWNNCADKMFRRKPAPTGKWVECAVDATIEYTFCHEWFNDPLSVTEAPSIEGYAGTRYQGRNDFVFTPPTDNRGVMLAPVAVRFWVEGL